MKYKIISCSLKSFSRSRIAGETLFKYLSDLKIDVEWIDMRDYPLDLCDGATSYTQPNAIKLTEKIAEASGILLITPVYNYNVSSTLKNLIEHTGKSFENKVAAFLCAAGGDRSYMSVMGIANSLMLDFRTHILPRFVYISPGSWTPEKNLSEDTVKRLHQLGDDWVNMTAKILS